MIQRIQSLYLLLITALLIAVLFLPLGILKTLNGVYEYTAFSIKQVGVLGLYPMPVWILSVLAIIGSALAFITIFLYKKRLLQIRLCQFNALVMVGFCLFFAGILFIVRDKLVAEVGIGFAAALPLLAIIFNWMTIKAIRKDEALVKSWDRMR